MQQYGMSPPLYETISWNDLIDEYVILSDKDKVTRNTRNDFGLKDGFVFLTGSGPDNIGKSTWGWLKPEPLARINKIRKVTAMVIRQSREGRYYAYASTHEYPGRTWVSSNITDIPEEVRKLISVF